MESTNQTSYIEERRNSQKILEIFAEEQEEIYSSINSSFSEEFNLSNEEIELSTLLETIFETNLTPQTDSCSETANEDLELSAVLERLELNEVLECIELNNSNSNLNLKTENDSTCTETDQENFENQISILESSRNVNTSQINVNTSQMIVNTSGLEEQANKKEPKIELNEEDSINHIFDQLEMYVHRYEFATLDDNLIEEAENNQIQENNNPNNPQNNDIDLVRNPVNIQPPIYVQKKNFKSQITASKRKLIKLAEKIVARTAVKLCKYISKVWRQNYYDIVKIKANNYV